MYSNYDITIGTQIIEPCTKVSKIHSFGTGLGEEGGVEEDTVKAELLLTLKLREREEKRLLNLTRGGVTGLFLSNENTIGPAIDLLALVLREASRDR